MELKQFIAGDNLTTEESLFNTHMDKIAQAFSENRVSALVGTGFSKNAKAINPHVQIPLWSQLGQALMKELGIKITKGITCFEDPIRLSTLYVAEFGETALYDFLKNKIDDNNFTPDTVHKKFIELNWNNIYTTNYDTLIEQADQLTLKKYSVVKKDTDFPLLPKPRIVKLHGSFPADTPFIMTEEQFRTYPQKHSIFVNSVQQSFIEDTIVLLGFSGADPNFIKWSGWIRDNLNKQNARVIYFISTDPLTSSEIKSFSSQNITVLDLSIIRKKNSKITISKIFERMFDYWNQFPQSDNTTNAKTVKIDEWFSNLWIINGNIDKEIKKQGYDVFMRKVTNKWKNERRHCPQFIILPMKYNNQLFWKTREIINTNTFLKGIENNEQSINFLYEFDWRWNLCNVPLFENIIEAYKKAIGFTNGSINIKSLPKGTQKKALKLLISLYKACRKNGNQKLCQNIEITINANSSIIDKDDKNSFYYERCLNAFFNLNYKSILDLITTWDISPNNIIWNIKKAGLLAETGNESQAVKILEKLLLITKNKVEKEPDNIEYLSLENIINWLLIWIVDSKRFDKDFDSGEIKDEKLRQRNKELEVLNCNIIDLLNSYSKDVYANKQKKLEKKEFDDERKSMLVFGAEEAPFASFVYINIFEKLGFPYSINNSFLDNSDVFNVAINNILHYQPDWALNLMIRSYNEMFIEKNIGFEELKNFHKEAVSEFVTLMLNSFRQLQNDLTSGVDITAKGFCNRLIKTYPELLSRLCVKVNSKTKEKLCSFLVTIIKKNLVCRMPNIENFVKRFINTLTIKEKGQLIPRLLCIKAPQYRPIDETRNLNPFLYLYPKNDSEVKEAKFDINQNDIQILIKRYSLENDIYFKKWYLTALVIITGWNLLDKENLTLFGEKLWEKDLDEHKLPVLNGFHKSVVLQLPCPKDKKVESLYLKMLMKTKIPIIAKQGSVVYPLDTSWYQNIYFPTNNNIFSIVFWKKIFREIVKQWKFDSKYLKEPDKPFISNKNIVKDNFRYSSLILERMVVVNCRELNNSSSKLFKYKKRIINQIYCYFESEVDCLEAMSAIILIDKECENRIYKLLKEKLASSERNDVVEVLNSINFLIELDSSLLSEEKKKQFVDLIIDAIFWQSEGDLEDCIKSLTYIMKLKKELITEVQINNLCSALKNIRKSLCDADEVISVHKVKIKSAAAGLAHTISIFMKNEGKSIPDEIIEWKNIVSDENEFVEIRNQWIVR